MYSIALFISSPKTLVISSQSMDESGDLPLTLYDSNEFDQNKYPHNFPTDSNLSTSPNATAPSVTSSDWGYSSKNLILSRISTMFEGFILVFAKITNFPRSYHCSLKFLEVFEGFFRTEEELILSATPHRGIDNRVPTQYVPVLQQLCQQVLEPLRHFVSQPIVITSGYRCSQLNVKVGGAYASQHTLGEAADLRLPLRLHVSCRRNRKANRYQVIRYLKK